MYAFFAAMKFKRYSGRIQWNCMAVLCLLCHLGFAQYAGADSTQMLNLVMGIQQESGTFYNAEGYTVFLVQHDDPFDEKGIRKIKKKYKLDEIIEELPDPSLPHCRVFSTTRKRSTNVLETGVYYLFPDGSATRVVGMQTTLQRDRSYEMWCVGMTIKQLFPSTTYTPMQIDSFNFAGRQLVLGGLCNWRSTRNVQCADYGQMNWSEFRSEERALEMVRNQYEVTSERTLGKVLSADSVDVTFEGQPLKVLRVLYKVKLPAAVTGGSNLLVIYYVAAEVRQRFVGCVLSQYTDLNHQNELAPLLKEVMQR